MRVINRVRCIVFIALVGHDPSTIHNPAGLNHIQDETAAWKKERRQSRCESEVIFLNLSEATEFRVWKEARSSSTRLELEFRADAHI
jgi:hypothetical protein